MMYFVCGYKVACVFDGNANEKFCGEVHCDDVKVLSLEEIIKHGAVESLVDALKEDGTDYYNLCESEQIKAIQEYTENDSMFFLMVCESMGEAMEKKAEIEADTKQMYNQTIVSGKTTINDYGEICVDVRTLR